jgi:hypothetical protein
MPKYIWGCAQLDPGVPTNGDKGGETVTSLCGDEGNLSPENYTLAPGTPVAPMCETSGGNIGVEYGPEGHVTKGVMSPDSLFPQRTGHLVACATIAFPYQ